MDKVNEVIEVNEQETPFHQLSQEEQQRIIDANQKGCVRHRRSTSGISEYQRRMPG